MEKLKRIISFVLAAIFVISVYPASIPVQAVDTQAETTITVESTSVLAGNLVQISVRIANNPGILGATLTVSYDEGLTLTDAASGEAFAALDMTKPGRYVSGCNFVWDAQDIQDEDIRDGEILSLSFLVSDSIQANQNLGVHVTCKPDDVFDRDFETVPLTMVSGGVLVIDYLPGDLNMDGIINSKDVVMLRRRIAGGYDLDINESAGDVNNDGTLNSKDVVFIRRYIADGCKYDPEGYGIKLLPATPKCVHEMEEIPYKAATCTEDGNIAYWHCTSCDKFYNSEAGTLEIARENTVLKATGHTAVTHAAQEPTYDSEGWYEWKDCSVCGEVLVEKVMIPKLEKTTVTVIYHYEGLEQDSYLSSYITKNDVASFNPNSAEYNTAEKGYALSAMTNNAVPGYKFLGWVDGYGNAVTSIAKGDEGHLDLYASWQIITYWVTFKSPDVPATNIPAYDYSNASVPTDSVHYTVASGLNLTNHNPSWYGYTFVGWSNSDGFLITEIKPGTTGNITVQANWTSNRNKATSYPSYGEPIIIEDAENGQFLFVYNIGKIENVPLNEIEGSYFHNMDTKTFSEELSVTNSVDEGFVNTINEMVSNATTKSSGWTLSNEWNDLYTSEEEVGTLSEKSDERTTSDGTVVGGKYFVSNSQGGSTYVSTESGGSSYNSSKITTDTSVGINQSYDESTEKYCDAELNIKTHLGGSSTTEVEAGVELPVKFVDVSAGIENTTTVEGSLDTDTTIKNGRKDNTAYHIDGSYSNNVGTVDINDTSSHYNSTASQSSNWNTQTGYERSQEINHTEAVTKAIKEQISKTTTHSVSQALGGSNSHTEDIKDTSMSSEEYATSFTYNNVNATAETRKVESTFTVPGHYRYITAGTVHVYGVVGYDVATASYYTHSFTVLDDNTRQIWDYSKDSMNFDDCENGVVTFDIPFEVNEYIAGVVGKTNGLEIGDNGIVNSFEPTEDFDGTIVIPQYEAKKNPDGTAYSAVKVTSFNATVFENVKEDVKVVVLPMYITEIPDNAFAGCTNLETVIAYGVTKIGDNSFAGCTSLDKFYVDNAIVSLGDNAFKDVPEVAITAYDSAVANAAANCGAKRISLNISYITDSFDNNVLEVPSSAAYFALMGNGGVYNNVTVESNAAETIISNMTFANNTDTPIELASTKVTLARVTVQDAPGLAVVLKADHVQWSLLGEINLSSKSNHAVISKSITLGKADSGTTSYLKLNGNYLVCGAISNGNMMNFTSGKVIEITKDEYESMLTSSVVRFNPNGGTVDISEKRVYYGQPYGELPVPTRQYYTFDGWYTAAEGGTRVTAETVYSYVEGITLYAHWVRNQFTLTFDANGGAVAEASRTVSCGAAFGELPVPTRDYYTFEGWYDAPTGGSQITASTSKEDDDNLTIYAHWSHNAVSDWVKVEDLPEGAEVTERKWSYTLTTETESRETSLSGYEQVGSRWVHIGDGSTSYASFPNGFDTSHYIYTSFAKGPYSAYETETSRRDVTNWWSGYIYWHWMYDCGSYRNVTNRHISSIPGRQSTGAGSSYPYEYFFAMASSVDCPYLDNSYCCQQNLPSYNCHSIITDTLAAWNPRCFRFDYYTSYYSDYYKMFQYRKVEELESGTLVEEGNGISNVQAWVKYRER